MATKVASAQYYPTYNTDISAGAMEQFTTPLTTQVDQLYRSVERSPALAVNLREHPRPWVGFEINYQFSKFSGSYVPKSSTASTSSTTLQEASAAYLMHARFGTVQPFVAIGGGELLFQFKDIAAAEYQPTALLDAGVDIPLPDPHFGILLQAHTLYYEPPTSDGSTKASSKWAATTEPAAQFYIRF